MEAALSDCVPSLLLDLLDVKIATGGLRPGQGDSIIALFTICLFVWLEVFFRNYIGMVLWF